MKKIIIPVIVFSLIIISASPAAAFWGSKKTQQNAPVKAAPPAAAESVLTDAKRLEAKARGLLASKDWMIYLTAVNGNKTDMNTDVVIFFDGKFSSRNLSAKGYTPSNFTVVPGSDGLIIWDTVLTADNGDIASWKGELRDDLLRGVVSLNAVKSDIQDFYFSNTAPEYKAEPIVTEEKKKR